MKIWKLVTKPNKKYEFLFFNRGKKKESNEAGKMKLNDK